MERYSCRGFADTTLTLESSTRNNGSGLLTAFLTLIQADLTSGNIDGCTAVCDRMNELLPLDRLDPPENLRHGAEMLCEACRQAGEK